MKTVIEMAREAGFLMENSAAIQAAERFAELVRADEREACAKMVDHILKEGGGTWGDAIRARSNT